MTSAKADQKDALQATWKDEFKLDKTIMIYIS